LVHFATDPSLLKNNCLYKPSSVLAVQKDR